MIRTSLVALALILLSACSSGPVKRVFPPEARIQQLAITPEGAQMLLRVQSFSTVPSEVQAYALTLEIAGADAVRLEARTSTSVLPQAAEVIAIPAPLGEAAIARARQVIADGTVLRYRLHGTITVEPTGRAYPIDYSSALSPVPGLEGVLR